MWRGTDTESAEPILRAACSAWFPKLADQLRRITSHGTVMNDAEIMELVDEVRRCERAVQQAKNALEVAKRDAAVAACPYKEATSFRDGTAAAPARQRSIKSPPPSYPLLRPARAPHHGRGQTVPKAQVRLQRAGCNTIRRRRMTPNERRLTLMWVAFFLWVCWTTGSRKGVMPIKWLVVRPDTSKPPARRITSLPAHLKPTPALQAAYTADNSWGRRVSHLKYF